MSDSFSAGTYVRMIPATVVRTHVTRPMLVFISHASKQPGSRMMRPNISLQDDSRSTVAVDRWYLASRSSNRLQITDPC
jgi:hypothetical protein